VAALEARLRASDEALARLNRDLRAAADAASSASEEAQALRQTLEQGGPRGKEPARSAQDVPGVEQGRSASGWIVAGWLCLVGALTMQALCPAAHLLYGIPLAGAFLCGGAAWPRRRSPLVTGLLALAMVAPLAMAAAVKTSGYQGLLPELAAPADIPPPTPTPAAPNRTPAEPPASASPPTGNETPPIPEDTAATRRESVDPAAGIGYAPSP
jgi:hypothetical protein